VDVDRLGEISRLVREKLSELVKAVKKGKVQLDQSGGLLRDLAAGGHKLYEAFFTDADNNPAITRRVRDWLMKQDGVRLTFFVDPRVHIPWGLIYSGHLKTIESKQPTDIGWQHYPDFWCLKYGLSVVYDRIQPDFEGAEIPGSDFAILPVMSESVLRQTVPHLPSPDAERLDLYVLKRIPVYSKEELVNRWPMIADQPGMLFFLGHADAVRLALSQTDYLTVEDVRGLRRNNEDDLNTGCLVFVNGCCTATGRATGGFLEATGMQGFYGFIGTEATVPNVFALRFGLDFIHRLLRSGTPVYSIMMDLRKQHWPLGLLYTTSCYPDLSIVPQTEMGVLDLQENFSHGPIASDD
jgi:hypothetical protein